MKIKSLFLGMLATAALVGCNNDVIDGPDSGKNSKSGETTTATFEIKFTKDTYAGSEDMVPTGRESGINDVALFIYKLDGTPEAMAYMVKTDWDNSNQTGSSDKKITVKCKSGDKLIYFAANLGGVNLINHEGGNTTNANSGNAYLGKDWNVTGQYGPKFAAAYTDADTKPHKALNSAIWSGPTATIVLDTTAGFSNSNANNLILALTGGGTVANGILYGDGTAPVANDSYYLMTNWGDASTQPTDGGGNSGTDYASTCKFTLEPGITADVSRAAGAGTAQNALTINIQRAVAKVSLRISVTNAGQGTSAGTFTPLTKWALGNINCSEYPFQMWDGSVVKSTRYDETLPLAPIGSNGNWASKMDNSRFAGTNVAYVNQNLSASAIVDGSGPILSNTANRTIVAALATPGVNDYALATENNNSQTFNHYNTFALVAGQYTPASYITGANNVGVPTTATATPGYTAGIDTMHYVGSLGTNGLFFYGTPALREYICYVLNINNGGVPNPLTDSKVTAKIDEWRKVTGNKQADLQSYWHGYCFYRILIRDAAATSAANKLLVRRNHAYQIDVTEIKGPGIGDPNDIIDPDPTTIEPVEEADTYVTAKINIMNWHVVKQNTSMVLE
jgi:hypothetical protein